MKLRRFWFADWTFNRNDSQCGGDNWYKVSPMSFAFQNFQNSIAVSKLTRNSTLQERLVAAGVRGRDDLDLVRLVNTRRENLRGDHLNGSLMLVIFVSVAMALGSAFFAAMLGAELVEILACYVCAGNVGLLGTAMILDRDRSGV